jgi:hypothetical protein
MDNGGGHRHNGGSERTFEGWDRMVGMVERKKKKKKKKRDALETESWRLREERRKFGERTDRFLGRYDVDSKSSAILGPTASNLKAQKTVCRGVGGPGTGSFGAN